MAVLGSRQDNQKNTHKIVTDNGLPEVATRVDDPNAQIILDDILDDLQLPHIVVSTLNSSTSGIGAGGNFTGTGEDVSQYSEITVNLFGSPEVAPGSLFVEFSPDGTNWDVSIPYTLAGPQSFVPLPVRVVLPFFRVRYVNGGTVLTAFRLTTVFHRVSAKMLTRVVNQSIDENEPVENVRSVQMGKSPDGPYTNLPATGTVASQSSNVLLLANASFNANGPIISTRGYLAVSASGKASHTSAVGGIQFQWFADEAGTRALGTTTFTYTNVGNLSSIQVPVKGPWFRFVWVNSGTNQTSFELVTTLLVTAPPADVLPINSTITGSNAASIVKAQITGLQENGSYADTALSNSASLKVAIADRPSEVRNRTRVIIPVNRTALVAGGTTLYTVTGGKILYISSFSFSQLNDSTSVGQWRLQDSATVRSGFIMAPRSGAVPDSATSASPTLPEPMPFTTNVNVVEVSGSIEIAGFLIGYEE